MFRNKNMKAKKILKLIERFLRKHWHKWTILAILGIVIYAGFVFYQYVYKPVYQPKESILQKLEIKKQIYQEIMEFYYQQEENISQIINKDYPNPFK